VLGDPASGGFAVVGGSGEAVFRGESIVDGDDGCVGCLAQGSAGQVVCVDCADDPSTAVEEQQTRCRLTGVDRTIDANREVARWSGNASIDDLTDGRGGLETTRSEVVRGSGLGGGERVDVG